MINIQNIQNVSDCVPLYLPHSLYLKPIAKINISVALPNNKLGKSISNLDIMEKLGSSLKPDKFLVLKVVKSTVEFIRFEAELDDRSRLRTCISRLDGVTFRVEGFSESFRVRASESKDEFPTRHDWDSFFRDASHMDEMKAGERPDTIHLTHLPIRWFCPRHSEQDDNVKPSESIFKRIFEKFGSVRYVDIPICDPYRSKMNSDISGMKTFSFEQDVLFEAYVQFDEYVGFVRAMDEFRGMKLVRKFVDKTQAINITVNFDKSKHLSDVQLQRRERVRKRVISKAKAEEEEIENQKKQEAEKQERERQKEEQLKLAEIEKQREREEKRKEKHLKKIQERGQIEISQKIRVEERKLMIAQRKLESIRILEQLFDRIRQKHLQKHTSTRKNHTVNKDVDNNDLRDRLVKKYKSATEKLLNEQKQKVQDIKNKTPILGLLNSRSKDSDSSDNDDHSRADKHKNSNAVANNAANIAATVSADGLPINPFKAVAALAAAGGTAHPPYSADAASEWMKSLSMFPYVPSVFPPMSTPALYRPPPFGVSMNYRGNAFAPRIRSRGRGRGRGRGGYDPSSSYYSSHYKNYNYDTDDKDEYRKSYSSGSRSRSRSRQRRSRSRRRSRSWNRRRGRSHSRSKSKGRRRSRSRSHSKSKGRSRRTRSRSRSRSKAQQRTNKKLVSTRRSRSSSRSTDSSRSRSRSRSHRSWTRRGTRRSSRRSSHSRSRSRSHTREHSRSRVIIETDKLVRSAEEIKRTIEKDMQDRMQEETREIKANFTNRRRHSLHSQRHEESKLLGADSLQRTTPKATEPAYSPGREQQKSERSSNSEERTVDKEVDAF